MTKKPRVTIHVRHINDTEYRNFNDLSAEERAEVWRRLNDTALRAIGYEPVEKEKPSAVLAH